MYVPLFEPFRVWTWITLDRQLNLFIMDRKCRSNVTIRPGLIWPSCPVTRWPMSSSRMGMGESDDGLITSTRNEIPSSIIANRLRSLSFTPHQIASLSQCLVLSNNEYSHDTEYIGTIYLHVFNSYHQFTTHAMIPLNAFDIIINSWLDSMII